MTRLRRVCRAFLSWLGLVPDTQDRPGSDEQWRTMPHLLDRFNEQAQVDEHERRWQP